MSKKKPTMREQIAELEAELAGCEVRIEELEEENAALQRSIEDQYFRALRELRDAFRAAGVDDSISAADGIRSLVDSIEAFRAHAAESEREACVLREELRTTLRYLHTTSTERNDWEVTAQSLAKIVQENGDKRFALLEKTESQRVRNMLRRAVRRALEVVR